LGENKKMVKKIEDKKAHSDSPSNKIENVFELINLASMRARELVAGSPKLIQTEIEDPMQIALEEIAQGKITFGIKQNIPEEKEKKKEK
jgi:DNA-directed RNA polymerase subunit omega